MRIGIDTRLLGYPRIGGMGRYLIELLKQYARIRPKDELVLFHDSRYPCPELVSCAGKNISARRFSMKGDALFLWEQARLPYEIYRSKVDVFHSPANTLPFLQLCPHVITFHDTLLMVTDEDETPNFLFYMRKMIPMGLKRASKIITGSQNAKNDIMRFFQIPPEKIEVIYHGIDPMFRINDDAEALRAVKNKYGIKGKYIFIIGSLGPRKNTARIIKAFSILRQKGLSGHQLVVGGLNNDAKKTFKKMSSELGLDGNMVFTGYVPNEDLVLLYNGAELSLYLSFYEGFGFPVLESMACGCPVITSNVSCMPEIAGGAAVLADPANEEEIADKMHCVLRDDVLRNSLREKGIRRARIFDWQKTAESTFEVYEKAQAMNRLS